MPHDHAEYGPDHDHDRKPGTMSPSGHPYRADNDGPLTYWQVMETAIRELLIDRTILTPTEIQAQIDLMDRRSPADGAAVVARAWTDPAYKQRLLADGSAASRELGFDIGALKLIVVENTADIHNLVVCTLCSCYPRNLLGMPPDWYKSREYRARAVREPRAVLAEFGLTLPETTRLTVHDSTADMRYLVLPRRPPGTERLTESELAALVSRDAMIGTAQAGTP